MKTNPARPTKDLAGLLRRLKGRRLAVVGDCMVDRYMWGAATRLSPEAAVPVVDFAQQSECLGGAANVAANLAALGARVSLFGISGNDEAARALRVCLGRASLSAGGILADPLRPTTLKTRIIARHQQVVRVDRESRAPLQPDLERKLLKRILPALRHLDGVVISDYDKGVVTDAIAQGVLEACRRARVPVFVKPKWSRLFGYRGAAVIMVNRAEAGYLVNRSLDSEKSVENAGRELLAHFECDAVVITRGEQGMSVFEREQTPAKSLSARSASSAKAVAHAFHVVATSRERHFGQAEHDQNAQGRQVFDVTGAGDTALAALALALAAGASVRDAALIGNAAAGVVVGKLGTAAVTPAELHAALREMSLG
jgi:D-beta-D-heptose 7-phosphate kinase/D-beta-D-heptose 1-phosphate adenosyltransferase